MGRSGAILTEITEIGGNYMKRGLDYYSISCVEDERLELIEAELGIESFAIIVKLLGKIYGQNGYYCQWDEDCAMLFARKNCVGYELVCRVVDAAVKRGFFSRVQLEENGILTSAEIQQFFLNAAKRRKEFSIDPRFSCIGAHAAETVAKTVAAVTEETAARESVAFPAADVFFGIGEPAEPYINESFSECGGCVTVTYPDCGDVGIGEERAERCDSDAKEDDKKRAYGRYGNVMLTESEHTELQRRIRNADDYIDRFSRKLKDKGYRYADHFGALLDWWGRDSALPEANGGSGGIGGNGGNGAPMASFDTDDFFAAALSKASRKPDAA